MKQIFTLLLLCAGMFTNALPQSPCSFDAQVTTTAPSCPGGGNGSIAVNVSGANGPFTFEWHGPNGSLGTGGANPGGLAAGTYLLIVGDTLACLDSLTITLPDGIDTQAPVLSCPANQTFFLTSGACEKIVNYQVSASDNCGTPNVWKTDNTGLSSGDAFPIGITTLSYQASDGFQNSVCTFKITVIEYFPTGGSALSCRSQINLAVNADCEAPVGAGLFLLGNNYHCFDDYTVQFQNQFGFQIGPNLSSHIGQTIYAKVTDPATGNTCTTAVNLADNLAPAVTCLDTIVLPCSIPLQELDPDHLGWPQVEENCSGYTLQYSDQYVALACDDTLFNGEYSAYLRRIWLATDQHGNTSQPCRQLVLLRRFTLADLSFPPHYTDLPGQQPSLSCAAADTSPAVTGAPAIDGQPLYPFAAACEFTVQYTDQQIPFCGGGYTILRTWIVIDDCQNLFASYVQTIKVTDKTPPTISCPGSLSVGTNWANCTAVLQLPAATYSDNCSAVTSSIHSTAGTVNGNLLTNVPIGVHVVTYRAQDACGNESQCQLQLTVYDGSPPSAVCSPSKFVSLTTTGIANINASVFNAGSSDDCGGSLTFQVRRLSDPCDLAGTAFGSKTTFCCADIGQPVPVQIKVTDNQGNANYCNSVVTVNDALVPTIQCPSDLEIACNSDYSNLDLFGGIALEPSQQGQIVIGGQVVGLQGLAQDNCQLTIVELPAAYDLDDCGTGHILRSFRATDTKGNQATCQQKITLVNPDPFYINPNNPFDPNDDVIYPPSITLSGCSASSDPAVTGSPQILGNGCALVGATYQDQVFNNTGNSYLVARHWVVIDFCQYTGNNSNGIWEYTQNITINNPDKLPPQFGGLGEVTSFCSYDPNCGAGAVSMNLNATDNCTPSNELIYHYQIDLGNDGSINLSGNGNQVNGQFPMGIHRLIWEATDESGNTGTAVQLFVVKDCLPPVAACADTLHYWLGNDNAISLSASSLQGGASADNCTAGDDLLFLAGFHLPGGPYSLPPAGTVNLLTFSCPDTLYQLDLYVGDQVGNWSSCTFHLAIHETAGGCSGVTNTLTIAGNIQAENGAYLEQVTVKINQPQQTLLAAGGNYTFGGLAPGGDYSVTPCKDTDYRNGVSTLDLVLIRLHILGLQPFASPYRLIAADANGSGSVTTLDMVDLQKLILFIIDELPNNRSWRFVDAAYQFPNPAHPFPFPESKSYNNLAVNQLAHFIGIKIGDVNGTADPQEFNGSSEDRRQEETRSIGTTDYRYREGESFRVALQLPNTPELIGFQMGLRFDPESLILQAVEAPALPDWSAQHFNRRFESEGLLFLSWAEGPATSAGASIELEFRAQTDGRLSDGLRLADDLLPAEGYVADELPFALALDFTDIASAAGPVTVFPNPFSERAELRFLLQEGGFTHLRLYDPQGKLVWEKAGDVAAGEHSWSWSGTELPAKGLYYYRLELPGNRATTGVVVYQ